MRANRTFRAVLASTSAAIGMGACLVATSAAAQETEAAATPTGAVPEDLGDANRREPREDREILVTGSRIRQDPNNSALPLQIISTQTLERNGISSPEQLSMFLTTNGTGADNLASNGDVTSGAQRGTNGLSGVNLRGQGSASTLVLLNGRRVAAHGLSGSAVDVNQIPFAAIDRIEVLKDGASAIYGTDAIGGVINYITKKTFTGVGATAFTDVTDEADGNIYNLSGIAGYGDLDDQGFNIMGAVSYRWNQALLGSDRSFVNGNQPNRGLSVDTRGTPIATAFNIGANAAQTPRGTLLTGLTLTAPNGANAAAGGINPLATPGGAGCETMDGGMAYDYALWNTPTAYYACAWDTGRAAVIQQPIETLTYYGRATVNLGASQAYAEITGSRAESAKSFSNAQLTANATNLPIAYPLNALTADSYNAVFNAIRGTTTNPAQIAALDARYGLPIAGRWRCIACGPREYTTTSKTFRAAGGVDGPLPMEGWDYRVGGSFAQSQVNSLLGSGYYYRGTLANGASDPLAPIAPGATAPGLVGLINSGLLNPFSLTQSAAGLAGLDAVSAAGTTLYGGKYRTLQFDGSISGSLFALPGGDVQIAVGVDYRRETYAFNGSDAAAAVQPVIFLAAFDNVNALDKVKRTVKAAYGEVLVPLLPWLELTGAIRVDDYSGFGTTTNPKVSAKITPTDWLMLRGSYSTGFRVPSFNQIFNGITESPSTGSGLVDPLTCPSGVVSATNPGCINITPTILTGGRADLGPEKAKMAGAGIVLRPLPRWSASADWYMINVDNAISLLTIQQLAGAYDLFPENFVRDPVTTGPIVAIDNRWINAGARRTQGVEFTVRGNIPLGGTSALDLGMDGSLLLKKKEKLTEAAPYGPSLIGRFTFAGDLGIKWKHNVFATYSNEDFALTLTQLYRDGYDNQALPGIANGSITRPDYNDKVKAYIVYNLTATLLAVAPGMRFTFGVKNLLDKDPPFAVTYDSNTGAGGSWEPRLADPRGRSFIVQADVKF